MSRILLLFIVGHLLTACSEAVPRSAEQAEETITRGACGQVPGVYRVTEIRWIYADTTYRITEPQPGFLHLTEARYSFIWTPTLEPRVPFSVLSQPTPEEMQAGFRSLVLNAGTYSCTTDEITIKAEIAKVPGFEGGEQVFTYQLTGDTLHYRMIDETYPDGSKPRWAGKMETAFRLVRIE